ncbi:hypothetical protein J5N97_007004 [Dioscorea zingiberensis]|uniref:Uncharacterized protein n=1 Tax=Dioscorea zingiberensis TaxID=325984 RepID=A0A9D5DB21_9LILI|nr:hypothetical protein J5N97_007004 [Dioscorea zingiberensis]
MSHSEKEQLHARACDGCARRRARWYCAADDAFLCQRCDASVHSANPLARRHERLRLKTGSLSVINLDSTPAWHHPRKARTPRPKPSGAVVKSEPLVPDLETVSTDENNTEEEQLLYCVPVFDHSLDQEKPFVGQVEYNNNNYTNVTEDDVELTEFAADMERLLGRGIEEDAFCMEGLGFLELKDENHEIKSEVEDEKMVMGSRHQMDGNVDLSRETLELNFDYGSTEIEEEEEAEKLNDGGKRLILRLDYEKVITAWSSSDGSSPWADGERPRINPDECWHYFMGGMWGVGGGGGMGQVGGGDGGREARVTRYREKRRTRLFAKKIRYEVRKLNAEKRPRMKGRFVKRVSVASSGFSSY